uniref:Zinc finger protein 706 n=2 Tax=Paramormyrops kingsleyae TaxID=1676925 RepID=A0A3B3TA36_9TELE
MACVGIQNVLRNKHKVSSVSLCAPGISWERSCLSRPVPPVLPRTQWRGPERLAGWNAAALGSMPCISPIPGREAEGRGEEREAKENAGLAFLKALKVHCKMTSLTTRVFCEKSGICRAAPQNSVSLHAGAPVSADAAPPTRHAVRNARGVHLPAMARGHQKIQSQQKNAKKQAEAKKSKGHDQKAAAKVALVYTCAVCRTQMPDPKTFKQHFESKHPKSPLPPELVGVEA